MPTKTARTKPAPGSAPRRRTAAKAVQTSPGRDGPVPVLCRYRVKAGQEAAFLKVLRSHWPTLRAAGLASAKAARIHRCEDKAGNVAFVEQFEWKTGMSAHTAHQTPAVMKLWEPMGAMCADMEFWHATPVPARG